MMSSTMFDYVSVSHELKIPEDVMRNFEKEAISEFPSDPMLMELHVLRALNTYAENADKKVLEHAKGLS